MTDRYHRQMLLPGVGAEGQARLAASHALVVGCGALGCAASDLLARAGVGGLTLVDRDLVEPTNLQRQVLFDERHTGGDTPKAQAAGERIGEINSGVRVHAAVTDFAPANAERIALDGPLGRPGVIVDGTDNYETRFLINDVAVKHAIPYVYAGAVGTRATTMTVLPGQTACLRCVFDGPPAPGSQPTCDTAGVLGPLIAAVVGVQASEAMKVLLGATADVRRTLLEFDLWSNARREIDLRPLRSERCACCGERRFEHLERVSADPVALCGRGAVQIAAPPGVRVGLEALRERLGAHGRFNATRFLVRGELAGERGDGGAAVALTVFADGRAIVQGVTDPGRARAIYARYVGS